jgi:hypothetical protein
MRCNPDQVKEDEMGRARSMHGDTLRNAYRVLAVKPEKNNHQEDIDVGWEDNIIRSSRKNYSPTFLS